MKIVEYSPQYKYELRIMLAFLGSELYTDSENPTNRDVDKFITCHSATYLVLDDGNVAIGFASYTIHNNYGMSKDRIVNDFLFVYPEYRGTKATYLLMLQTGKIIEDMNIPLEHCYASDGSSRLGKRLKGKKQYDSYLYEPDEVMREFSRLKKIVKIKE